jgi:hypothetical protein
MVAKDQTKWLLVTSAATALPAHKKSENQMPKFILATTLHLALIATIIGGLPAAVNTATTAPTEEIKPTDTYAWGWSRKSQRSGYW